jgi:hypothetical protein
MLVQAMLLVIYILVHSLLNFICYLISFFYQKKFKEYAPKNGFLIIIVANILLLVLAIATRTPHLATLITAVTLIGIGNIASVVSAMRLYNLMKKARK